MSKKAAFKRILLKISGEALKDEEGSALKAVTLKWLAEEIHELTEMGIQPAVVVGGGNFFRGIASGEAGIVRDTGDYIGMMATVMNGLALRDAADAVGLNPVLMSALSIEGVVPPFDVRTAWEGLSKGKPLILTGGTGHPYFTTDTTAALRACELHAEVILKGTQVSGVYSADPRRDSEAVRYTSLTYSEALEQRLGVMDLTAFSLCRENEIPIVVFNMKEEGALGKVARGDFSSATYVGDA